MILVDPMMIVAVNVVVNTVVVVVVGVVFVAVVRAPVLFEYDSASTIHHPSAQVVLRKLLLQLDNQVHVAVATHLEQLLHELVAALHNKLSQSGDQVDIRNR